MDALCGNSARFMMKKAVVLLLSAVFFLLPMAGCKGEGELKPDASSNGDRGSTLIVGSQEASGLFHPLYYSSAYDADIVRLVFEDLINRDREGEIVGRLAESWELSEDERSITFHLKTDHTFSDGEPVTAEDVEFTALVLCDPSYTGRYGAKVRDLVGYDAYVKGETNRMEGIEVLDEATIRFTFREVLRTNLENFVEMFIVPKHYYGKEFTVGNTAGVERITSAAIGSGPYTIDKFAEKQLVSLKKREDYPEEGFAIQNVIVKFINQTTDIQELMTGNVDLLAGQIEPEKIDRARGSDKFSFNTYPRSGYGYLKFNCEYGPTADKAVRQALYYSFHLDEYISNTYRDKKTGEILATVQYHPFSQISWVNDENLEKQLNHYTFNLDKAKQILDDAGWKVGPSGYREKDGRILELKVAAMPDNSVLDTLIPMWQRDWGSGLDCKLDVAYLEFNTLLDYVLYDSDSNVDKWSMYFMANTIQTPDPHETYNAFHSNSIGSGKDNTNRYSNPEIDALLDKGKSILDEEEAKPVYQQIARILNDDAVMIPIYANTYFDLYSSRLTDFDTGPIYGWAYALRQARLR